MKIFISHSTKDRIVARKFKYLFDKYSEHKYDVFLSSDMERSQIEVKEWKLNLQKHLKKCDYFVVLESPNSLNSQWVQYEIGFATASLKNKNNIIPIGIKGVSPEKSLLSDIDVRIVEKKDDLVNIMVQIFGGADNGPRSYCIQNKDFVDELLGLCKERCVYFVGSAPTETSDNKEWKDKEHAKVFLEDLTKGLLNKDIKVSSFPTVEEVGKIVWDVANLTHHTNLYEISGLYNFDKLLEKEKDFDKQNTWREILRGFRRLYLKNKSSMVIIGGGIHTKEEYDVAHDEFKQIEIFPIPCFNGIGKELFDNAVKNDVKYKMFNHPCYGCDYEINGKKCCPRIDKFVKRLSQYKYIDEDERES